MREDLRDLVVLHGEILVSAIRDLLDDPGVLIDAEYFDGLFSIVNPADTSLGELLLQSSLLLSDVCMRKLHLVESTFVDLVPDETEDVLRVPMNVFKNLRERLLSSLTLLGTLINDIG